MFASDGADGNLYEYPVEHIQEDYLSMLDSFGPDDADVREYKQVLDYLCGL